MISPQAIHELKEAAEAATLPMPEKRRRPWFNRQRAYSALANPATIKALIADYERMRGENERMREALNKISNRMIRGSTASRQDVQDIVRQALGGQSHD